MASVGKESHVDVLISGAGPAGLMASMYLSEMGISHRIVDQRGTRTLTGRADGFHARTMEIWDSFGMADRVQQGGVEYGETSLWTFDDKSDDMKRVFRDNMMEKLPSRLKTGTMSQAFIEAAFIAEVRKRGGPNVERGTKPASLHVEENPGPDPRTYPITVHVYHMRMSELDPPFTGAHSIQEDGTSKLERGNVDAFGLDPDEIVQHVSGEEGTTETIHAKYLIGADGAHSWLRRQLPGFKMEGDNSDAVFGVLDIIPLTNFPDIRKVNSVLSKEGYCLTIPRELGLVRLYVQMSDNYSGSGKAAIPNRDDPSICIDILNAARKILAPYTMDYRYCDWWTIYRVGQRVCTHASYLDRVFLAGDAIHTHSPKGGQGMNVSQQDTYSLAWKIAGVLRGQLAPSVLSTYESERIPVAHDLINLDKYRARLLTAKAQRDQAAVLKLYDDFNFNELNGTKMCYQPSSIQATDGKTASQEAAIGLLLGMRFPDTTVYSQALGTAVPAQSLLRSNGAWRLLVFAGSVTDSSRLHAVNALGDRIAALAHRYPPASPHLPTWLHVLLFHASRTADVEIGDFHDAYFPPDKILGRSYYNIYADRPAWAVDDAAAKCAHEVYGINVEKGALVLVRPDQIVAWVGGLHDLSQMEEWLAGFMISCEPGRLPSHDSGVGIATVGGGGA